MDNRQNQHTTNTQPATLASQPQVITSPAVSNYVGPTASPVESASNSVLSSVHACGILALVIGVLVIFLAPLLSALLEARNNPGASVSESVLMGFIYGLFQGIPLIFLGLKLARSTVETLGKARKVLMVLIVFMLVITIGGLIAAGSFGGILNIILIVQSVRAYRAIPKASAVGVR